MNRHPGILPLDLTLSKLYYTYKRLLVERAYPQCMSEYDIVIIGRAIIEARDLITSKRGAKFKIEFQKLSLILRICFLCHQSSLSR